MNIIGAGTLEQISTRVDGSLIIKLSTQEMESEQIGNLFALRNAFVKWYLTNDNITDLAKDAVNDAQISDYRKIKTPSQRLRAVLYRLHETAAPGVAFEEYYAGEMERIIEHYKQKIEQ